MRSKTKNRKTRAEIQQMVSACFEGFSLAQGEGSIIEFEDGWFNAAYLLRLSDGREIVLKIAPPPNVEIMAYEQHIMRTEVAAMQLVARNPAIPVPEIHAFDTSHTVCESDYFFMDKLTGENLDHIKEDLPPDARARIERQIGAIIREINGFTGDYFGYEGNPSLRGESWRAAFIKIMESVLQDGEKKNAAYGFSIEDIRATYLPHTAALEDVTTPHLVHWDAWDPNFFVENGQISGLLDFERALWADPLMEAQFRQLAFNECPESLIGYGKTSFTPQEDQRNHLYTLHLALVMVTECYYRDYDTDDVQKFALNLLATTLAWLKA